MGFLCVHLLMMLVSFTSHQFNADYFTETEKFKYKKNVREFPSEVNLINLL